MCRNHQFDYCCFFHNNKKLLQLKSINTINTICISHWHGDHFSGLFSILWYYWLSNRSADLNIIGPPQTKATTEKIFTLFLISGIVSLICFYQLLISGVLIWAFVGAICGTASGFYFRHTYGTYGLIGNFENAPMLTPPDDIFKQAKKCGVDLKKRGGN